MGFVMMRVMRLMLLGVLILFFVVLPMYLLNAVIMPELNGLQNFYANSGAIAEAAAGQ